MLPPGESNVGEVIVRGVNVMRGYYDDPEATAAAFTRGWLHTGDLGYFDKDGFLFIVDRKKDLIIRGGYNVYPREVEEVLYTHPQSRRGSGHRRPRRPAGRGGQGLHHHPPGVTSSEQEVIEFVKERWPPTSTRASSSSGRRWSTGRPARSSSRSCVSGSQLAVQLADDLLALVGR